MNGSGKTTLLRTLVGELACLGGEVYQQPRALRFVVLPVANSI